MQKKITGEEIWWCAITRIVTGIMKNKNMNKIITRFGAQLIVGLSVMILGQWNILNGLENWFGTLVYFIMWTIGWVMYSSTFE